jgi:hypothetical protein
MPDFASSQNAPRLRLVTTAPVEARCPRCGTSLFELTMNVRGLPVSITICGECGNRQWDADGVAAHGQHVLDRARRSA